MGVSACLEEGHKPRPKVGGALSWDSRIAFHARSVPEGMVALGSLPSLPIGRDPRRQPLSKEGTNERGRPRRATNRVQPTQQAVCCNLEEQRASGGAKQPDRE